MTTDTQVNAYIETRTSAAADRAIILQKAKEVVNFTNNEMANLLGWKYSRAQCRISELKTDDLLYDTGLRRIDVVKDGAVLAYNPNPKPKPKKLKPIGVKEDFTEMMRTIYAFANKKVAHNEYAMDEALKIWGRSMAEMIRQGKIQNNKQGLIYG